MTWLELCFRELILNRQGQNWKVREQLRIVMTRRSVTRALEPWVQVVTKKNSLETQAKVKLIHIEILLYPRFFIYEPL